MIINNKKLLIIKQFSLFAPLEMFSVQSEEYAY